MTIYNVDCLDYLRTGQKFQMVFADPPDNIGLGYGEYQDTTPAAQYYGWLETLLWESMRTAPVVWFSYYWKHDLEIKYVLRCLLKYHFPAWKAKTFIWRFTFGQHNQTDCGSGFRFVVRLTSPIATIYPNQIMVESERQRIGDSRANPAGRVPDDVLDFPRVVGNSSERRAWHPTQHPESLMRFLVKFSTKPKDRVLDLFLGSGTTYRVCQELDRECVGCEIDEGYCLKIAQETGAVVKYDPVK